MACGLIDLATHMCRYRFASTCLLVLLLGAGCSLLQRSVRHPPGPGVDLNRATREELTDLPGLTDTDAERIVAGRPYSFREDVVLRGIVTPEGFERFAHRVYGGRPPGARTESPERPGPHEPGD
jgi:hypothetical protein